MFYSGLFCIAFGCAVMWYFQHTQGIGFGTFQCLDGHTTGISTDYFQARIPENLHKLLVLNDSRAVPGIVAIIAFCCFRIMRQQLALGITFLSLLLATIAFGIVDECRVWLPMIPVLILTARK
jgi:hypothetical protein